MIKSLKIYFVHLKEILQNIGYFPVRVILSHLFYWVASLRFDLNRANGLYEHKHNEYVLKWLERKYGFIIPQTFQESVRPDLKLEDLPIWVCWLQGEKDMPDLVKTCYDSIKKNSGGRLVRFISLDNIEKYIEMPVFLKAKFDKGFIKHANYSDILRLMLLYKYGGTWIDATIYLSDKLDDSWRNPLFSSIKLNPLNRQYTISQYKWATFYLFAYPQSPAVKCVVDVLLAYWKDGHKKTIDYFLIDFVIELLYRKNPEFRNCIDTIPYTQERIYDLQGKLNQQLCPEQPPFYDGTYIYKLNWRTKICGNNTIYTYLKERCH